MAFILPVLSPAPNLPGEPVVPPDTGVTTYYVYINGPEVVLPNSTVNYSVGVNETITYEGGRSSSSPYSPIGDQCVWTVPSGFNESSVNNASSIELTTPSDPIIGTLSVNIPGIGIAHKPINVSVELKEGANVVDENSYVYIDSSPRMPQLTASLKPTGLSGNAKWRLHIEYKRSPRNDDEYYPGPTTSSWKTLSAGATWNIASEFGTDFRGGKATLYCEYQGVEYEQVFHIRAINPYENAVEDEIGATPWYAIPIAKWESDRPSQGIYYAQFNEVGVFGPNPDNYMACPNFGGPNGWGIMQLDPPPSDETLWNWKQNIADGKAHLANPCRTSAAAWIARQEAQQQSEEPTMPLQNYIFTFNGVAFQKGTARTPTDACTIQRYNGNGADGKWVIYWKNKTETEPGSWECREDKITYIEIICGQIQ